MLNRREFLAISGCGLALMALPVSASRKKPVATFDLRAREGSVNLTSIEGMQTAVWQYNGQTPGPLIRVRQGKTLRVAFNNGLSRATSVHWHGLRIDNRMDGVPGMT